MLGWICHLQAWPSSTNTILRKEKASQLDTHIFSFAAKRFEHKTVLWARQACSLVALMLPISPQRDWFSQCEHGSHAALHLNSCFQFRRKEIRVEHITVLWARHARSLALILNSYFQFQSPQSNSSTKQHCEHGTHAALSYSCFQFRRKETDSVEYKTVRLWAWPARSFVFKLMLSVSTRRDSNRVHNSTVSTARTTTYTCTECDLNSCFQFHRKEIRAQNSTVSTARTHWRSLVAFKRLSHV